MWNKSVSLEISNLLGEGGQGRVYKALRRDRQTNLQQPVAVKILHSQTTVDLWRLEFESLARIRSRYCVQVLSFERYKGRPALILEYVNGLSLAQISQMTQLPQRESQELVAQLECALRDLHSQGVLHGDLSPQNIMVDTEGCIRLLDFGLANCTRQELRMTPRFAAPERLRGETATEASDLYALGRIAELLGLPTTDNYLKLKPGDRKFQGNSPSLDGQKALGEVVERLIHLRASAKDCVTQILPANFVEVKQRPLTLALLIGSMLSFFILSTSTASQMQFPLGPQSTLIIRTDRWHRFTLNNKSLGYAPVSMVLKANEHYVLHWASSQGQGTVRIYPGDGDTLRLSDSDFSH